MYPSLFSLKNLVDVLSTRTDPQEMYPLLFSVTTTQVDVPSTCTTKDVPSNVLRQSSQAVSPLKLCEWRHKRIQAVSPLFFWKREKRDTKRIQAVSPWRILFGKGITTTQVDVPSTCTTKDVPSNVLRQSSQAVSPLKLCERETKDI
ncbi:hypothetical protein HKD37_01G001669 [Glycine soja]